MTFRNYRIEDEDYDTIVEVLTAERDRCVRKELNTGNHTIEAKMAQRAMRMRTALVMLAVQRTEENLTR